MSERVPPKVWAEQTARARGYDGPWPPRRCPAPQDADDLKAVLSRMDAGELATSNVQTVGTHLSDYFALLSPNHFRNYAETLITIILWEQMPKTKRPMFKRPPTARVKLRACQTLLRPACDMAKLVPKIQRQEGDKAEQFAHMLRCIAAFIAPFENGILEQVIEEMNRMVTRAGQSPIPAFMKA